MATLVNGNGNPAVYAQQDADLYVGVMGTTSCIMSVGSKFAATIETANLISVADGVILTKEGRRIQTDVGEVDEFNIPNGAAGVTRYYIIGYHLYTDGQGSQKCETFVQLMSSATDTIPEAEFRNGATEVYVSLYRVTQVGLTLNDPESLLPDALNIGDINASLTDNGKSFKFGYDTTSSAYGYYKSEGGADTFVPFKSASEIIYDLTIESLTPSVSGGWRAKITSTTKINGVTFGYGLSSSGIDYNRWFAWSVADPSNIYAYFRTGASIPTSTVLKGEVNDVFAQLGIASYCNMQVISYDDYSLTVECSSEAYIYFPRAALAF